MPVFILIVVAATATFLCITGPNSLLRRNRRH